MQEILGDVGKPDGGGPIANFIARVENTNGRLGDTLRTLDSIIERLEGPKPSQVTNGEGPSTGNSLFATVNDRLDITDKLANGIEQLVSHLDEISR